MHNNYSEIDDLIDVETSINNAMEMLDQAEQILEVLIYIGRLSENRQNETQLKEVAHLLFDAQHELLKGLLEDEPELVDDDFTF